MLPHSVKEETVMEEKILQTKKNGMVMLLLTLLGYAVTVLLFFYSIILLDESLFPGILLTILSIAYWVAGIFLLCGLKVLKPQEALVLTLFADYTGTLRCEQRRNRHGGPA